MRRKLAHCGADQRHSSGATWPSRTSRGANCSIAAMPVTTPALRPAGVTLTKKTVAAQHNTAQHSTTQHSSQHSTTQHSTAHIHLVLIPSYLRWPFSSPLRGATQHILDTRFPCNDVACAYLPRSFSCASTETTFSFLTWLSQHPVSLLRCRLHLSITLLLLRLN